MPTVAGKGLPIAVYPQEYAYAIGYPPLPSSTDARLTVERYETVAAGDYSVTISPCLNVGRQANTQRQCTWQTQYSVAPSAIGAVLEGSIDNVNWTTVDTSVNTGGESRTVSTNYQKFRIHISSLTGSGAAIVKIAFM